ncbi:unnamed protein product [Schistosoma mattheei]|uniref:Uncharacterized protein n=1 Tax=Schistosoma mattheei TaxID=31246 RepID=A0AA85BF13_9TREM|nr:unnamed protein product [Schistosoma mattheei]CAH8482763.1 unnamed protein product [Schistosoma mattheei]
MVACLYDFLRLFIFARSRAGSRAWLVLHVACVGRVPSYPLESSVNDEEKTGWINASRGCLVFACTKWLMVNFREIRSPSAVIVLRDIRGLRKKHDEDLKTVDSIV